MPGVTSRANSSSAARWRSRSSGVVEVWSLMLCTAFDGPHHRAEVVGVLLLLGHQRFDDSLEPLAQIIFPSGHGSSLQLGQQPRPYGAQQRRMCGGQAAQAVDFCSAAGKPHAWHSHCKSASAGGPSPHPADAGCRQGRVYNLSIHSRNARPASSGRYRHCSAHGFTGQQTAVGGTAPDGLVTLPRGDALCLQFFKK